MWPEPALTQGLGTIIERTPARDPSLPQLEEPGHLVLARRGPVLGPMPAPGDQRHRPVIVLVELVEDDMLLDPTWRPGRPQPRRLDPLAQPPGGVDLDLGIQDVDEGVEIALVEGADELAGRVYGEVTVRVRLPTQKPWPPFG